MRKDGGVTGEGRVVVVPKFHSWGKCTKNPELDFRISLDFRLNFWIDFWISQWISGFQFGFLPTVYKISFVTDPSHHVNECEDSTQLST